MANVTVTITHDPNTGTVEIGGNINNLTILLGVIEFAKMHIMSNIVKKSMENSTIQIAKPVDPMLHGIVKK